MGGSPNFSGESIFNKFLEVLIYQKISFGENQFGGFIFTMTDLA